MRCYNAAMEAEPPKAELPKRKRRWFQFSLRTLMIGVTLCACLFGVWGHWDYLPGTIRRDKTNGFIHGTGSLVGFYWDGTLAVQEDYRNGILLRQIWYRPDGSLFVSSDFDTKQGGTAYNLRYDGTIR